MLVHIDNVPVTLTTKDKPDDVHFQYISKVIEKGQDDAFYVTDLTSIANKIKAFTEQLPRVKIFYAVKCNDDKNIVKFLSKIGCSFDCASQNEIQLCLTEGVAPDDIIYANPCKQPSMLKYAAQQDVKLMTFDSEEELLKINDIFPGAKLVIRLLPPGECRSECWFGNKFGVPKDEIIPMLIKGKELGLDIVGLSFHVGSVCYDPEAYIEAIHAADWVFKQASNIGYNLSILDIGGGFPAGGYSKVPFNKVAEVIRPCLDDVFPESRGVTLISEPGRYVVAGACTLLVNVIGKKEVIKKADDDKTKTHAMYYLNDGLYGDFNCIYFDPTNAFVVETLKDHQGEEKYESSLWGPTCDGIDVLKESISLPKIKTGEWLMFRDMGAYTLSAASSFNGFTPARSRYIMHPDDWTYFDAVHKKETPKKDSSINSLNMNKNGFITPGLI